MLVTVWRLYRSKATQNMAAAGGLRKLWLAEPHNKYGGGWRLMAAAPMSMSPSPEFFWKFILETVKLIWCMLKRTSFPPVSDPTSSRSPKYFFLKKSNRRPVVVKIVLLHWKYVSDIEKHCCRSRSRCENCENFENYNTRTTYVVYRFSVSWDDKKSAPVGFSCWNWFYCFFGLSWGHSMEKCWGSNFSTL